jgi:hypothetical protein
MSLTITIEVDTADVNRVLNAIATNYKRLDEVPNPAFDPGSPVHPTQNPLTIDNPQSKEDFLNQVVRQFLTENVYGREVREAKRAAADTVNPSVGISKG